MSKQKQSKKPEQLPDLIHSGELFIQETYLRLHRQKRELTTEQASKKLEFELKSGAVVVHHNRAEIIVYKKV